MVVVGVAMNVKPFGLSLSPMPAEACDLLAETIAASEETFPQLNGEKAAASHFMARFQALRGIPDDKVKCRGMLLYQLRGLKKPVAVSGCLRQAVSGDLPLISEWTRSFYKDVGHPVDEDAEARTRQRLESGFMFVWTLEDGTPVAMVGHAAPVTSFSGTVTRIAPVYTPPEHRKHGYASAATAAVCERLEESGVTVMLFADAANPTSNAIYQAIGFELNCENVSYEFE